MSQEKLFVSEDLRKKLSGKYLLFDNDFLSGLYKHGEFLKQTFPLLDLGIPLLDPLVEFEFLRDLYNPEDLEGAEEFVSRDLFKPVVNHQEVWRKIQENAILLSKLYSYKGQKGASFVDLHLAARLMQVKNAVLITGNKKDFPSCSFNIIGVVNSEFKESGGNLKAVTYWVVEFSKEAFTVGYKQMRKMIQKYEKRINKEKSKN